MDYNEDYPSDIMSLFPSGTNSTMFTGCCQVAICSDQRGCPKCGRPVVGDDAETDSDRSAIRWDNATRMWKRR